MMMRSHLPEIFKCVKALPPSLSLSATCLSAIAGCTLLLSGCGTATPIPTVKQVDIPRFMGDWYVVANIPTFVEKGAHNALESYALNPGGTIATTFTFNKDSFAGEVKQYNPTGFVKDTPGNADWQMQFIWPIKAEYKIVYLTPDYSQTIIGRSKRDYIWFMARDPQISDADYQTLLDKAAELGYDTRLIQRVPQQSLAERQRPAAQQEDN